MSFRKIKLVGILGSLATMAVGCASSQIKARKDQRDKVAISSRLFCDFVNGEIYPDVEVQLNLEMAKHCEHDSPMSVTQYRTSNENMGIVYCCSYNGPESKKADSKPDAKTEVKKTANKSAPSGGDGLGD
jgi:hypothetical protein